MTPDPVPNLAADLLASLEKARRERAVGELVDVTMMKRGNPRKRIGRDPS